MSVRQLTVVETQFLVNIWAYYRETGSEMSVFLETPNGNEVESVAGTRFGADPSASTIARAHGGERFVLHHNHPSQSSFSDTDWFGAAVLNYSEIFAHSEDGTTYWGVCLKPTEMKILKRDNEDSEIASLANRAISDVIRKLCWEEWDDLQYVGLLDMHVLNLALKSMGIINYDVTWGNAQTVPDVFAQRIAVNVPAQRRAKECLLASTNLAKQLNELMASRKAAST